MICATVWAITFCKPIRLAASASRAWVIDDMAMASPAFFSKGCVRIRLELTVRSPCSGSKALAVDSARAEVLKHSRAAAPTVHLVAQAGQERLHGSGDFGRARNKSLNAMVGVQLNVPLYAGGYGFAIAMLGVVGAATGAFQ